MRVTEPIFNVIPSLRTNNAISIAIWQLATGQGASEKRNELHSQFRSAKNMNLKLSTKVMFLYKSFKIYICIIFFLFYRSLAGIKPFFCHIADKFRNILRVFFLNDFIEFCIKTY